MKLLSLNTGTPQPKEWNGEIITTSIFKKAVSGSRKVFFLNIEGDIQSDLNHHGGVNKAVYAYDSSYYEHWKKILEREDWERGLFGENLTTEGLTDDKVCIGNVYRIGSAKLQAIQPRFPCTRLNIRFGLPDMIERFFEQKRHGIYFRVVEEGIIEAGDSIELVESSLSNITIQNLVDSYTSKGEDKDLLKQILEIEYLPEKLKRSFQSFVKR